MKFKDEQSLDRRTSTPKRWQKLFSEFLAATGTQQGRHIVADRAAAKTCATLSLALEKMDRALQRGEKIDLNTYVRALNSRQRLLNSLGLSEWSEEDANKKPRLQDLLRKDKPNES